MGRREADREWVTFAASLASGEPTSPGRRTFVELLERWFDKCSSDGVPDAVDDRPPGSPASITVKLSAIDTAALDEFYTALRKNGGRKGRPLATSSVVRVHGIVQLALD